MITQKQIDAATKRVEAFLHTQLEDPATEVSLFLWPDFKRYGIRVAEVSFFLPSGPERADGFRTGGGSSFMQVDSPHGGAVCFYAERLLLDYLSNDFIDDTPDDEWRLCHAAFEKDPK